MVVRHGGRVQEDRVDDDVVDGLQSEGYGSAQASDHLGSRPQPAYPVGLAGEL